MDLLAVSGVLLGVLSIFLTILSFKYKKLSYYIKSITFDYKPFKNKIKKVEISYNNQSIERLTISRVIFFNKGNKGISKNNIVPNKPIKIELSSPYKIYEYTILYNYQEERSELKINQDYATENILPIGFEYLEPYQGAVIQILHNGCESDLKITGGIRNIKNIEKINEKNRYRLPDLYTMICSFTIVLFLNILYDILLKVFSSNTSTVICMIFGVVLFIIKTWSILIIKEISFLTLFFPNTIPIKYLRILNSNWIVE